MEDRSKTIEPLMNTNNGMIRRNHCYCHVHLHLQSVLSSPISYLLSPIFDTTIFDCSAMALQNKCICHA
jgi:hypothetical protein